MTAVDLVIVGGGPAGAAAAIRAARAGAVVHLFEKGKPGRDKVCGDGLTPRAISALLDLGIATADTAAHRIDGLRMIAGQTRRDLPWPSDGPYPPYGAVWPRRCLDTYLLERAAEAGATIHWEREALPTLEGDRVTGVEASGKTVRASMVVIAAGAPGKVARRLGIRRVENEPYGIAIRTYVESPRSTDRLIEASLAMRAADGTPIPGYGWMFPAGDGTVNLGVGALSTMKGFKDLNLNSLCDRYRDLIADEWEPGPYLERPRAWRLPMSTSRRHGPGWVAVGDAAGLVNPMNGEGIDYALESGALAAELFVANPVTAPAVYDRLIGERFDQFLRTGRRFSRLIGNPLVLRTGLRVAVGTDTAADLTLKVMGNLIDTDMPGASGTVMSIADRSLAVADPLLRRLSIRRM